MYRASVFVAVLVLSATIVSAQSQKEYKSYGYVFAGPGVETTDGNGVLAFGGGGEGLVYRGLGVGAEIGGLFAFRGPNDVVGILSPNVSYNFLKATQSEKLVPFITGGYSLLFRFKADSVNAVNFGGGVNYWFKERIGLRLEVRDHVTPDNAEAHILTFRAGLSFR